MSTLLQHEKIVYYNQTVEMDLGETHCIHACKEWLTVFTDLEHPIKPRKHGSILIYNDASFNIISAWL
jgi:hypothetical protein